MTASEALYGFAGWLTGLDFPVTFSARHDAAIAADMVNQYCKTACLEVPREDFHTRLPTMPLSAAPLPREGVKCKACGDTGELYAVHAPDDIESLPCPDCHALAAPPVGGEVGRLVEKWAAKSAEFLRKMKGQTPGNEGWYDGAAEAYGTCADDLHAALSAPAAPVGGGWTLEQIRAAWDAGAPGAMRTWDELASSLAAPAPVAEDNTVPVDRGALTLALNVLRRAGKDEVADALSGDATPPAAEPVGEWVRVPREPTPAMARAYWDAGEYMDEALTARSTWAAMLAAAPSAATGQPEGQDHGPGNAYREQA